MNEKEKDILEALRKKLLSTKHVIEEDFLDVNDNNKTQKCIYYLRRYEDNVFACKNHSEDFDNGRGGETKFNKRWQVIPMASLRSSAALTWNIFGDEKTCLLKQKWNLSAGEYVLNYEWNKSETIPGHYANLDAYLHNDDNCHLFVEMKMLEPLTRSHPFNSIDRYLEKDICPEAFQKAIIDFQKKEPLFFDAFQMIKHLLAIYNYCKKMEYKKRQKVVLLNCHWEPSEDYKNKHSFYSNRTISLEETYKEFKKTADRFVAMLDGDINFKALFNDIKVDLELAYCKHDELIDIVGKKNDRYLERYEI